MAVTPWRTVETGGVIMLVDRLQFGHGGDAVENSTWTPPWAIPRRLPFGHGGDAVENTPDPESPWSVSMLQFGHGGDAVENKKFCVNGAPTNIGASIRPRR